ncbi:MAG: hypothetical protein U0270_09495 [Labilithrix sp.]
MSVYVVSLAAEFPNDNPALHAGVSWVCLSPLARPTAELSVHEPPPRPVVVPEPIIAEPATVEVREPLSPREPITVAAIVEPATLVAPEVMAAILEDSIIVEDLEPMEEVHVEGVVPVFESIAPPTVPEETNTSELPPASDDPFTTLVCTLADVAIGAGSPNVASMLPGLLFDGRVPDQMANIAGIWESGALDPSFEATVSAWRAILRGTSEDFSDCGMLDEWASDLLARLLDAKDTTPRLRQELRARGVAAFGLSA